MRPVSLRGDGGGVGGGGSLSATVAEYGLQYGAVLCFQKRLSAATQLQLLPGTAVAPASPDAGRPVSARTSPASLMEMVNMCMHVFKSVIVYVYYI